MDTVALTLRCHHCQNPVDLFISGKDTRKVGHRIDHSVMDMCQGICPSCLTVIDVEYVGMDAKGYRKWQDFEVRQKLEYLAINGVNTDDPKE